jgi:hypothetical protein
MPANLSNVVAIAAGGEFALALKRDGTVMGWGANEYGQTSVPAGLGRVGAIAAGYQHSVAVIHPLRILSIWKDEDEILIEFRTFPEQDYFVEHCQDLGAGVWLPVFRCSVQGDGTIRRVVVPAGPAQQFYRLRVE